jgi:lambda family phage portal protein
MVEGGEAVARLRPRFQSDGLRIPLQVQLMEGDWIDSARNGNRDGVVDMLGVRYGPAGQRLGLWLFSEHPGERSNFQVSSYSSKLIEAGDVLHLYRPLRIGQARGVSAFAPVVMSTRDLGDLLDAIIVKARIEACFAGFITSDEGDGGAVGPETSDADGNRVQTLQPGMLRRLRMGESVEFGQPSSSLVHDPIIMHTLMAIAVGTGVTYDQLTGDLRQANYSSLRAGKIEQRRLVEQIQYQVMVPMFCAPVWRRFIEMAILAGEISGNAASYPAEWIAPAHEAIDPLKDLTADIAAVRSGRMTLRQFIASWGNEPDAHLQEIAATNKLIDDYKLILDSDPRTTSQSGLFQAVGLASLKD